MRTHLSALGTIALLLVVPLAGCVGGSGGGPAGANGTDGGPSTPATTSGNASAAASTKHVHDRWEGRTVAPVIDRTVATGATTDVEPTGPALFTLICAFTCGSSVEFAPQEGRVVPPGTANVTLTASWDETPPPGQEFQVMADYMPANATEWIDLGEIESGQSVEINTTVEMADGGHAEQSLWRFRLFVLQCSEESGIAICLTRFSSDEMQIDVDVQAHRGPGELPLEPPHPDWWGDGPVRGVAAVQGQANSAGVGPYFVNLTAAAEGSFGMGTIYEFVSGDEHDPVPPDTAQLVANVTWSNDAATADAAGVRPFLLYYHGQGFRFRTWAPEEVGDGSARFTMPLQRNMTDGMYVENRSRWAFFLGFQGARDTGVDEPFVGGDVTNPYLFQGSYELSIRAFDVTPGVGSQG